MEHFLCVFPQFDFKLSHQATKSDQIDWMCLLVVLLLTHLLCFNNIISCLFPEWRCSMLLIKISLNVAICEWRILCPFSAHCANLSTFLQHFLSCHYPILRFLTFINFICNVINILFLCIDAKLHLHFSYISCFSMSLITLHRA